MEGKRILVTGASGLIGTSLCMDLVKKNEVWGLSTFRNPDKKQSLKNAGVKIIQKDVVTEPISELPTDFDVIFHQLVILYEADKNPKNTVEANAYFTGRLMEHCSKSKAIVLASTGGVYRPSLEYEKETNVPGPYGWYATSKLGMEYLGTYLSRKHEIPSIILRYFWPYGAEQGRVTRMMKSIKKGEEIVVSRLQEDRYQTIYIDDIRDITIKSVESCVVNPPIFNVAGLEEITWRQMATKIGEEIGIKPIFKEVDEMRLSHLCDISKMRAVMGDPKVNLKEGMHRVRIALGF